MEERKSRPNDHWRRKGERKQERSKAPASAMPRLSAERVIFGMHPAEAALSNPRRKIRHAYLTDNASAKLAPLLASRAIAITPATPAELDALLGGGAVHQGVVLDTEPLSQPGLDEFLERLPAGAPSMVVMLDQVTDPHNVGAVLRSAAAFGAAALIVQARHSPPLSGTLAKTASGALEYVPVIEAVNLARSLDALKEHGFHCIGFDSEADQQFGADSIGANRVALVFGAEDKGLRRLIREGCDSLYALSAPGPIKSLNISNAAAIVFYEAARQIAALQSRA